MDKVVVVGSGNLAWHLVPNLQRIGLEVEIWTRQNAVVPTHQWTAPFISYREIVPPETTYAAIFLAVPDDHIGNISQEVTYLLPAHIPVVHTSGASSTDYIDPYFKHRAAMWPIRSLKLGDPVVHWRDLPLVYYCDQAKDQTDTTSFKTLLQSWVHQLSGLTYELDNQQRAQLHLAAVFSNNFTTWLCQIAFQLCQQHDIPFAALVPIIKNTFSKIDEREPALRQTGAAIRGDQKTMDRHLTLLDGQDDYQQLYQAISRLIGEYRDGIHKTLDMRR